MRLVTIYDAKTGETLKEKTIKQFISDLNGGIAGNESDLPEWIDEFNAFNKMSLNNIRAK